MGDKPLSSYKLNISNAVRALEPEEDMPELGFDESSYRKFYREAVSEVESLAESDYDVDIDTGIFEWFLASGDRKGAMKYVFQCLNDEPEANKGSFADSYDPFSAVEDPFRPDSSI